jgi:kumamolisin
VRFIKSLSLATAFLLAFVKVCAAQEVRRSGSVVTPQSSIEHPADAGVRFHTNTMLKAIYALPEQGALTAGTPPFSGLVYETPSSLGCVYRLVSTIVPGCNPNTVTENPTGGSGLIAIVDAFDDPNAMSDLNAFSSQFGLPLVTSSTFEVVYATGTQPEQDPTGGWEGEESLDIELAHAMAPGANLVLVEAATNSNHDLLRAVTAAGSLVAAAGGGEILMDWGGSETPGETSHDWRFTTPGVVYISSTGDSPGTDYPSVSPNVVAVGGSRIRRDSSGNSLGQRVWHNTGGGPSLYESRPAYQDTVASQFPPAVRDKRGTPDVSFDGDPNTGAWVYDSIPMTDAPGGGVGGSNWYIFGGTSLSAAAMVGMIDVAGHFSKSSARELTRIYNHGTLAADYHDIVSGTCGVDGSLSAAPGWDYCTGVGTPIGYGGK